MSLSDLQIKKLKPEAKSKKYSDSEGLYLLVSPSGAKCWRLKYRHLGKEKVLALGMYPEISLQAARDQKHKARQLLRDGKDPNTEKKDKERLARFNSNNTFLGVAKEWHELNKDKWTTRHSRAVWNRLDNHAFPVIGNRPISELHSIEILEDVIRKIEKNGNTETSHRVLQLCSSVFRFAVLTKRIPYNPLADLRGVLKPHRAKNLPSIRIEELPEFLKKLNEVKTKEINKLAIKMLLLTFVRQGELRKAKWEHFDFEKNLWTIPAHLMKMREEHLVPLSRQSIEVLKELKKISGDNEYLFPTGNKIKNPHMNENTVNKIIAELGYKGRMVGHGFRSLASTTLNELGYKPDIIERQLAHSERNQVRAAYNRAEYLPQRKIMMQGWADYIDEVVEGKKEDKKVLNIRERK